VTSCLSVVNSALRKVGVLASGREARAVDRDDTFEHLKNLYRMLITAGTFGRLRDVIPLADYTAYGNERIFRNSDATLAITLPETVRNYTFWNPYSIFGIYPVEPVPSVATNRDVTTPRDCSVVTIIDAFIPGTFDFIYDGQTKTWQGLYDLSLTDEAPLSFRDPQGLSAMLAMSIVDEFSGALGPMTVEQAKMFRSGLTSRFSNPDPPVYGEYY
jgi:hypothetical protein